MRYALISPQNTIQETRNDIDLTAQVRPGWKWLPYPVVARPNYDPESQVATMTTSVGQTQVTDSWSVRAMTAQEIDAVKQTKVDAMDIVLLRLAFNHENRIRILEGKAAITIDQFKTAVKAIL